MTTLLPHAHGSVSNAEALRDRLGEAESFQSAAEIFKQLGDGSRLRIFWLLCHREECVVNIAAFMGMTTPAISHHLRQLKAGGLITGRRDGKEVYYRAAGTERCRILHGAIERVMGADCPGPQAAGNGNGNGQGEGDEDYGIV